MTSFFSLCHDLYNVPGTFGHKRNLLLQEPKEQYISGEDSQQLPRVFFLTWITTESVQDFLDKEQWHKDILSGTRSNNVCVHVGDWVYVTSGKDKKKVQEKKNTAN